MEGFYHTLQPSVVYYITFSIPIMDDCLSFRWAMTTITEQTFSRAWQVCQTLQKAISFPHEILIYLWWFCRGWRAAAFTLPASAEDHEFSVDI